MNIITKLPVEIRDIIKPYVIGYKYILTDYFGYKSELWTGPQKYKTGIFRGWYPEGQLWFEHNYCEGERHGICQGWYDTGQLKWKYNYYENKRHGLFQRWYPTGQLEYQGNYYQGEQEWL